MNFVESSLVLLPLLAVFMGIIDFSMAIFLKATFQNAVREGVRYAITYQTQGALGQDQSIKNVVQNNSMGFLSDTSSIQVNYYTVCNASMVSAGSCTNAQLGTIVGTGSNSPGNIVEVSVNNYGWTWLAPLNGRMDSSDPGHGLRSTSPLSITAIASDIMGGLPVGSTAPPGR